MDGAGWAFTNNHEIQVKFSDLENLLLCQPSTVLPRWWCQKLKRSAKGSSWQVRAACPASTAPMNLKWNHWCVLQTSTEFHSYLYYFTLRCLYPRSLPTYHCICTLRSVLTLRYSSIKSLAPKNQVLYTLVYNLRDYFPTEYDVAWLN